MKGLYGRPDDMPRLFPCPRVILRTIEGVDFQADYIKLTTVYNHVARAIIHASLTKLPHTCQMSINILLCVDCIDKGPIQKLHARKEKIHNTYLIIIIIIIGVPLCKRGFRV